MARKCHSPSCTWMKIHRTVRDLNYKMGPWLVGRPLEEVQVVANQGGSHLLVVVAAGELEDQVAVEFGGGSGAGTSGGGGVGRFGSDNPGQGRKHGCDLIRMMIPISKGRPTNLPSHQDSRWQGRSHERANQRMVVNTLAQECDRVLLIPQLIETWLPSTCHIPKRGPSWVSIHWTGPRLNWRRCTRQG